MVKYTYDAWGKLLDISDYSENNLGSINPLRYRGYYYDQETGLYYLQSRYYDPTVGRFINADDTVYLEECENLFSYCASNPIIRTDVSGDKWCEDVAITSVETFQRFTKELAKKIPKRMSFLRGLVETLVLTSAEDYFLKTRKATLAFSVAKYLYSVISYKSNDILRISKAISELTLDMFGNQILSCEVRLLFGSHHSQIKIIARGQHGRKYGTKIVTFIQNGTYKTIYNLLKSCGVSFKRYYVKTGYYYR